MSNAEVFLLGLLLSSSCGIVRPRNEYHLVPVNSREVTLIGPEASRSTGCWIRLYDERSFAGEQILVHSGQSLRTLDYNRPTDWRHRVESFEVGPDAEVEFFHQENFITPILKVGPSVAYPGIHGRSLGKVRSLGLRCLKSPNSVHRDF